MQHVADRSNPIQPDIAPGETLWNTIKPGIEADVRENLR